MARRSRLPRYIWLCRGMLLHKVGEWSWTSHLLAYKEARKKFGCDGRMPRINKGCRVCKGPVAYDKRATK